MLRQLDKKEIAIINGQDHSNCGPSSLYRILACPGSVQESMKVPKGTPSIYAQRGTLLHEITEQFINFIKQGDERLAHNLKYKYEDSHDLTDSEWDAVLECYSYLRSVMAFSGAEWEHVAVEFKGTMMAWGLDEVWGTADIIINPPVNPRIDVIDWKFGSGVQVFAQMNEQGMAYAGISTGYPCHDDTEVHIHIGQPFLDHWDEWVLPYTDLAAWVFNELEPGLKAARSANPPYNPGDKQCRFCPAAMTCPARHARVHELANGVFAAYTEMNEGIITLEQLAEAHDQYMEYKAYGEQIVKFLHAQLMAGVPVPGRKLVEGRSQRKFKDSARAETFLIERFGDDAFERKLLSVAKAEKKDKALKKDKEFLTLWEKAPGAPQMVDINDPREAIIPAEKAQTQAEAVFSDYGEGD